MVTLHAGAGAAFGGAGRARPKESLAAESNLGSTMNSPRFATCLGSMLLFSACASNIVPPSAMARATQPAQSQPVAERASRAMRQHETASAAPLPPLGDSDADCVFLKNAARAITQYQAFIARAGSDEAYVRAVQRSHEQIADLEAEIEFVSSGLQQRGAQCLAAPSAGAQQSAMRD